MNKFQNSFRSKKKTILILFKWLKLSFSIPIELREVSSKTEYSTTKEHEFAFSKLATLVTSMVNQRLMVSQGHYALNGNFFSFSFLVTFWPFSLHKLRKLMHLISIYEPIFSCSFLYHLLPWGVFSVIS